MPRIAYIPPPIDFSDDRGQQIMAPMLANAQNLANTFITEIPRIRMQQEAVAEDKRRYQGEQDYRLGRDKLADTRYDANLKMTMEDREAKAKAARKAEVEGAGNALLGSIQPGATVTGRGTTTRGARSAATKTPPGMTMEDAYKAAEADAEAAHPMKREVKGDTGMEVVDIVDTAERERVLTARRDAIARRMLDLGEQYPDEIVPFMRSRGFNSWAGGESAAGAAGDSSMTMPDGTPRMSQAQLEMALAQFEKLKQIPLEERAAQGFDDNRMWNIYKHLRMQMGHPGDPADEQMVVPAPQSPATAQETKGAAAPQAAAPVSASPSPAPYSGFQRTDTPAAMQALAQDSSSVVDRLARKAQADPQLNVAASPSAGTTLNFVQPNTSAGPAEAAPLRLHAPVAAELMRNPQDIPWWLSGQAPPQIDPTAANMAQAPALPEYALPPMWMGQQPPPTAGTPFLFGARRPAPRVAPQPDWFDRTQGAIDQWYRSTGNR